MLKPTRRFISGFDKNNQSKILSEETIPSFIPYEILPSFQIQELFYTEDNPQSLKTRHLAKPYNIELPESAFRFMTLRMPTRHEMEKELRAAGQAIPADWTKFNIHSTDSIDYVYVLSGEINYIVGNQITKLKQGDFLAQIGPEHSWFNDSNEACMLLCIMIGIKPSGNRKTMMVE